MAKYDLGTSGPIPRPASEDLDHGQHHLMEEIPNSKSLGVWSSCEGEQKRWIDA